MAKAAASDELRSGLMEHLEVTRKPGTADRARSLRTARRSSQGQTLRRYEGHHQLKATEMLGEVEGSVKDVAITSSRAGASSITRWLPTPGAHAIAEQLGNREIADLLQRELGMRSGRPMKNLGQPAVQIPSDKRCHRRGNARRPANAARRGTGDAKRRGGPESKRYGCLAKNGRKT